MSFVSTVTTVEVERAMSEVDGMEWNQGVVNVELAHSESFLAAMSELMGRLGWSVTQAADASPFVAFGMELGAAIEQKRRERFLDRFATEELTRMLSLIADGNSTV